MTNWPTVELAAIATIGAGNSAPQDRSLFENGSHPFFRTSDVGRIHIGSIRNSADCLNDRGVKGLRLHPSGTILFPKSGASTFLNHRVVMEIDGYVSSHLATIRPHSPKIIPQFLFHYLTTVKAQDLVQDGNYPSLRTSEIANVLVPLPPLSEQQRIVAILDQAFKNISKAKVIAERNLRNANELGRAISEDFLAERTRDSTTASLNKIADFKNGLNFTRSSKGEVIRIVGVADFKNNFWTPEELEEVEIEGSLSDSYELRDNDLLVVRSNGNKDLIGRCILARGISHKTSHSGFTIRVRVHSDHVHPEYLAHFMKSAAVRKGLVASGDGANISSLNQKALSSIMVPIPSLAEQKALVRSLGSANQHTEQVRSAFKLKHEEIDQLLQSLLHQAFNGNL